MKRNLNAMLKNKIVLYLVFFIAVSNVFGYLMINEYDAIMLFFLVGFLTSYFSKNMIIVMATAIIATNTFIGSKKVAGISLFESFDSKKTPEERAEMMKKLKKNAIQKTREDAEEKLKSISEDLKKADDEEKDNDDETFSSLKPLNPLSIDKSDTGLDYTGSLEAAYDNLDKLLSSDALSKMSKDTQILAEKQNKLMGNIGKLTPMIESAQKMMKTLDNNKIDNLMNQIMSKNK